MNHCHNNCKLQRRLKNAFCVLFAALLCLANGSLAIAQVVVDSKLDAAEILVGEQVHLTTSVTVASPQQVQFPEYAAADTLVSGVEVLHCSRIDTTRLNAGKRLRLERTYTLTSFDSALYALPPMKVIVDGKTYTSRSRLGLKVGSVPVDTLNVNKFEPPFAVTESPFVWRYRLLSLSSLPCLFIILFILMATRLTGHKPIRRKVTIKPPTPPYKKAKSSLDELQKDVKRADDDAANKAFFVRLTDILRTYITERFDFNAMEKTTSEIVTGLCGKLDEASLRRLTDLFTTADFIKFAKRTATDMERKHYIDQASDVLATTRDEAMEHPHPIVRYITYSDTRQHRIRVGLWIGSAACFVLTIASAVYVAGAIWNTYF